MSGGEKTVVDIYTDGACSGNPGPGGWGAILRYGERGEGVVRRRARHHQQPHGTDGRDPGAGSPEAPGRVRLHTDSQYCGRHHQVDPRLEARGWQTADKKPVKNVELWQRLDAAQGPS